MRHNRTVVHYLVRYALMHYSLHQGTSLPFALDFCYSVRLSERERYDSVKFKRNFTFLAEILTDFYK